MKLGERIRVIRQNKGITQKYVSEKLGYESSSSLCAIEKGEKDLPSEKIPILAKILNVSIEELFFEEKLRETQIDGRAG